MMISPYCGFFKEERDDKYAPPYGMCELCYRYDICKRAEIQKMLVTGVEDVWIKEDQEAWEEYLKAKERFNLRGENMERIKVKSLLNYVGGNTKIIIGDCDIDEFTEVWRGKVDDLDWYNIPYGDKYIEHITVVEGEDWLQIWV